MRHLNFHFFFFNDTATTEIYTLSLHDALPISPHRTGSARPLPQRRRTPSRTGRRSEEHTSELQSRRELVCRPLLEKKKYSTTASAASAVISKYLPNAKHTLAS